MDEGRDQTQCHEHPLRRGGKAEKLEGAHRREGGVDERRRLDGTAAGFTAARRVAAMLAAAAAAAAATAATAAIAAAATASATTDSTTTTATTTAITAATTVAAEVVGREGPEGGDVSNFGNQREPARASNGSAAQGHHGVVHTPRLDPRAAAVLAHASDTEQSVPRQQRPDVRKSRG